jgi:hypothetical protein
MAKNEKSTGALQASFGVDQNVPENGSNSRTLLARGTDSR